MRRLEGPGLFLLLVIALGARAESPRVLDAQTGALDGKLTDTRSVPLSLATVVVRNLATGSVVQSVTGKNGSYRFTGLGPGEYRLEASVPSLGSGAVDGILVSAGHVTRIQAALRMEAPAPSPLPVAVMHLIYPIAPAVNSQIPAEDLASLPLAGRDWQAFEPASPAPGETLPTVRPGAEIQEERAPLTASLDEDQPSFHVNFQVEQEDAWGSQEGDSAMEVAAGEARDETSPAPGPSLDEARSTVARPLGSLHGEFSYSNRQRTWNSVNPFTQWVRETTPAIGIDTAQFAPEPFSPPTSRQDFRLGMGSPLKWKKASWFAAGEVLLRDNPAVATVRHSADFFAQPTDDSLQVLAARLDSSGLTSLAAGATAYSAGLESLATLLGPVARSSTRATGLARLDARLTERQHVEVDGNFAYVNAPGGARTRSAETYGSHSFGNSQANQASASARWEAFLTPNLLNSLSAQFRAHTLRDTPQTPSAFEQPLASGAWGFPPEIIADSRNGFILGRPARLGRSTAPEERSLEAQETLSWVRGRHLFRFGGNLEHLSDAVGTLVNQNGTYSYTNVLNFISDLASFERFGLDGVGSPSLNQHNCDETGRVHRSEDVLLGLGYLPCYSWYSQRVGPANWHVSTNELAAFAAEQWQPLQGFTLSASLRVEAQQLPAPINWVANADLPLTTRLPSSLMNFAPRLGIAWSPAKGTVVRLGAGMYFGRVGSAALLAALTQTGSPRCDLNLFFKPTDESAPPFPYVFSTAPQTIVKPGAVSFASNYHLPEIDQAVFSVEQQLPGRWMVTASALASLVRRLPISIDTNIDPAQGPQTITYAVIDSLHAGPLKAAQVTVPLYTARSNENYQQLATIESRANSTYDAAMLRITHSASRGLTLHAHYLYGHATDWNPNESWQVAGNDVLDPQNFHAEYGTSNLDIRHTAGLTLLFRAPWKLHHWEGAVANGWALGAIGQYRSGRPFTMRTGGSIPGFYNEQHHLIEGVATGMNGSGGDNRVYGTGSDGRVYAIGRNTYRYPSTWTGDTRLGKRFEVRGHWELELMAESFNLLNHQNVTRIETTGYTIERGGSVGELLTLNFLTGLTKAGLPSTTPEFGQPLDVNATNTYHPREFQLGLRVRF